jgi:hypothetical protein
MNTPSLVNAYKRLIENHPEATQDAIEMLATAHRIIYSLSDELKAKEETK